MTREIEGRRRRPRGVTVLATVPALVLGALVAGLVGTASAAPADGPGDRGDRDRAPSAERDSGREGAPAGLVEGTPCSAEARACVDRAGHRAWLIADGRIEVGPVPAAPGGPGKATPLGTFAVEWKNKDHRSAEFGDAPMPFAVFFAPGGIAFHEGDVNSPSAGCVRLDRANAERWYATLQVGDRVEVHG